MPWRKQPVNPYHILVSEIMLQQTTVATVKGYFTKFLNKWPTIEDLAESSQDELMQLWQGLGYYSRARNLHKTAKIITENYQRAIPNSYLDLIKLPGLGPYTAAAVLSIAFNKPIIAIDTNVTRVLCRLFAISATGTEQKKQIQNIANQFVHEHKSCILSQALMDIGSSFCKAKNPKCGDCFLRNDCAAFAKNSQNILPKKPAKLPRPKRYAHTFVTRYRNQICIEKRPEKGLLGGLYQFPMSEFSKSPISAQYPLHADWQYIGTVRHVFSHFELELTVWESFVSQKSEGLWIDFGQLNNYGLPTMFKKALTYIRT